MQPSAPAPDDRDLAARTCGECKTANRAGARYCKSCGGSLVAPPECPACRALVPGDARFCSGCGAKLVGGRPARARAVAEVSNVSTSSTASTPLSTGTPVPPTTVRENASGLAARELGSLTAQLPRAKPRSSNIVGNVLLFFAALSIFIVVMYAVNKDAPKSVSPFMGGPAPGAAPAQTAPAAQTGAAENAEAAKSAGGGGPIRGVIKIDPTLASSAPPGASLFIFARNQGMPDRGPPIAVKKIESSSFPVSFELGPGDVMMGMPFTGPFDLYVRLDADGNAMTKAPGDLVPAQPKSGVSPGATGVEITLDKRL